MQYLNSTSTEEAQTRLTYFLADLTSQMSAAQNEGHILELCVEHTKRLINATRTSVAVLREHAQSLVVYAVADEENHAQPQGTVISMQNTSIGTAFRRGKAIVIKAPSHFEDFEELHNAGINLLVHVPLVANNQPYGVLSAATSNADWSLEKKRSLVHLGKITSAFLSKQRSIRDAKATTDFIEKNPHPVIQTTSGGIILSLNNAAQIMFGSKNNGHDIVRIIPEIEPSHLKSVQSNGGTQRIRSTHKDQIFEFDIYSTQFGNGLYLYGRNVTIEVKAAEELTEAKTVKAAIQAADSARADAMRAINVRQKFLAHVSHEIRTPITAILGYAELLGESSTKRTTEEGQYLDIIIRSSRHLMKLATDTLDLARIESGKFNLVLTEGSLPTLILDVVELLRVRANEKNIMIEVFFETPLPTRSYLDFPRLRQILLNVIGNAVKFTDVGTISVRASTTRDSNLNSFLVIEIEDTGMGIDAQTIHSIFNEFEGLQSNDSENQPSTGLGLAISQRFARKMGGNISVVSQPGKGSCFTIHTSIHPHENSQWTTDANFRLDHSTDAEPQTPLQFKGRVLLAEDTRVVGMVLVKWLESMGLQIVFVEDGQAACEHVAASDSPFDLILMDMQMPRLNGYQAARRLRSKGVTIPIVAVTAHAVTGERERCIDAGCTDYLSKPVERSQIARLLKTHLKANLSDEKRLSTLSRDDAATDLLDEFYDDLAEKRLRLEQLIDELDREKLLRFTHELVGMASTFGFPELQSRARELEEATRSSDMDKLEVFTVKLRKEMRLVLKR